MKKHFKALVFATLLLLGVFMVTGCGKDKNTIVGSWAYGSYVYTFNEDKTCSYDTGAVKMECTYEVEGDKLSILYKGNTAPFETTYSLDGNKLNVKDSFGNDTIYQKK